MADDNTFVPLTATEAEELHDFLLRLLGAAAHAAGIASPDSIELTDPERLAMAQGPLDFLNDQLQVARNAAKVRDYAAVTAAMYRVHAASDIVSNLNELDKPGTPSPVTTLISDL